MLQFSFLWDGVMMITWSVVVKIKVDNSYKIVSRLSRWPSGKRICLPMQEMRVDPWVGKIPCRRKCQPTPVFLPGEFLGQSVVGYSPCGYKKSDTTERLSVWTHTSGIKSVIIITTTVGLSFDNYGEKSKREGNQLIRWAGWVLGKVLLRHLDEVWKQGCIRSYRCCSKWLQTVA